MTGRLYLNDPAPDGATGLRWAAGGLAASAPLTVTVDPATHSSATDDGLHAVTFSARADADGRLVFSIGR